MITLTYLKVLQDFIDSVKLSKDRQKLKDSLSIKYTSDINTLTINIGKKLYSSLTLQQFVCNNPNLNILYIGLDNQKALEIELYKRAYNIENLVVTNQDNVLTDIKNFSVYDVIVFDNYSLRPIKELENAIYNKLNINRDDQVVFRLQ